jgi:predicted enzyme related to lactoylglutathione lyase|tara:strand:+ start:507 stop:740 length:234 start_codon:yes stop_codon:yes gene_type:complete
MRQLKKIDYLEFSTRELAASKAFFSDHFGVIQCKVDGAGGLAIKPILTFSEGRHFDFTELSGNEFTVWPDQALSDLI